MCMGACLTNSLVMQRGIKHKAGQRASRSSLRFRLPKVDDQIGGPSKEIGTARDCHQRAPWVHDRG
jgi:hypothetical protein